MELNKTHKWFYLLTGLCVVFILTLGSWWLFLVFKLANKLNDLELPVVEGNLLKMIQWEGLTFFVFLIGIALALFYFFFQDHLKTKSLQAFFASMTHELKTPLASIRLQSQVLNDLVDSTLKGHEAQEKIIRYTNRLQEDTIRLESELDKHLQLSRIERGAPLNSVSIDLVSFLKHELKHFKKLELIWEKESIGSYYILSDEFALSMIFRNLFENFLRHTQNEKIYIRFNETETTITLDLTDKKSKFSGELLKLGTLFYKFQSPKGSGIGLYLIKKLLKQMGGSLKITNDPGLVFHLTFLRGTDE